MPSIVVVVEVAVVFAAVAIGTFFILDKLFVETWVVQWITDLVSC
jgi:hypothetical protein